MENVASIVSHQIFSSSPHKLKKKWILQPSRPQVPWAFDTVGRIPNTTPCMEDLVIHSHMYKEYDALIQARFIKDSEQQMQPSIRTPEVLEWMSRMTLKTETIRCCMARASSSRVR